MNLLFPIVQRKIKSYMEQKELQKKPVDGIALVLYLELRPDIVYANIMALIDNKEIIRVQQMMNSSLKLTKNL